MNTTKKTTAEDLNKQIKELKAKHKLQTDIEKKLPGIKIYSNHFDYKGHKYTFTAKLEEEPINELADKIQQVIKAFPPTKNNTIYTASKDQKTESSFVLKFENGIRHNKVKIDYVSGKYWIHIDLPVKFYEGVIEPFTRGVYDCEYHYFGGTSMTEIKRMQIRAYKLRKFDHVKYYGGDVACYLAKAEFKETFEKIVLTGKE